MILSIDSRNNTQLILKLDKTSKNVEYDSPRKQDILLAISRFLDEEKVTLKELTAIEVETGPGAFTSLRVGIAIANTLAWSLQIPINGHPAGTTIEPNYGKEASITSPKKHMY